MNSPLRLIDPFGLDPGGSNGANNMTNPAQPPGLTNSSPPGSGYCPEVSAEVVAAASLSVWIRSVTLATAMSVNTTGYTDEFGDQVDPPGAETEEVEALEAEPGAEAVGAEGAGGEAAAAAGAGFDVDAAIEAAMIMGL